MPNEPNGEGDEPDVPLEPLTPDVPDEPAILKINVVFSLFTGGLGFDPVSCELRFMPGDARVNVYKPDEDVRPVIPLEKITEPVSSNAVIVEDVLIFDKIEFKLPAFDEVTDINKSLFRLNY